MSQFPRDTTLLDQQFGDLQGGMPSITDLLRRSGGSDDLGEFGDAQNAVDRMSRIVVENQKRLAQSLFRPRLASAPITQTRQQRDDRAVFIKAQQAQGDKEAMALGDPGPTPQERLNHSQRVSMEEASRVFGGDLARTDPQIVDDYLHTVGLPGLLDINKAQQDINQGNIRKALALARENRGGIFDAIGTSKIEFATRLANAAVRDPFARMVGIFDPEFGRGLLTANEWMTNPDADDKIITGLAPQVIGSALSFVAASAAVPISIPLGFGLTAGLGAGALGATLGAGEARILNAEHKPGMIRSILNIGMRTGMGLTEALGVGNLLRRMNVRVNGIVDRRGIPLMTGNMGRPFLGFLGDMSEEAAQEVFQQFGENAADKYILELERDLDEGLFTSAGSGAGAAAFMRVFLGAAMKGARGRFDRSRHLENTINRTAAWTRLEHMNLQKQMREGGAMEGTGRTDAAALAQLRARVIMNDPVMKGIYPDTGDRQKFLDFMESQAASIEDVENIARQQRETRDVNERIARDSGIETGGLVASPEARAAAIAAPVHPVTGRPRIMEPRTVNRGQLKNRVRQKFGPLAQQATLKPEFRGAVGARADFIQEMLGIEGGRDAERLELIALSEDEKGRLPTAARGAPSLQGVKASALAEGDTFTIGERLFTVDQVEGNTVTIESTRQSDRVDEVESQLRSLRSKDWEGYLDLRDRVLQGRRTKGFRQREKKVFSSLAGPLGHKTVAAEIRSLADEIANTEEGTDLLTPTSRLTADDLVLLNDQGTFRNDAITENFSIDFEFAGTDPTIPMNRESLRDRNGQDLIHGKKSKTKTRELREAGQGQGAPEVVSDQDLQQFTRERKVAQIQAALETNPNQVQKEILDDMVDRLPLPKGEQSIAEYLTRLICA